MNLGGEIVRRKENLFSSRKCNIFINISNRSLPSEEKASPLSLLLRHVFAFVSRLEKRGGGGEGGNERRYEV